MKTFYKAMQAALLPSALAAILLSGCQQLSDKDAPQPAASPSTQDAILPMAQMIGINVNQDGGANYQNSDFAAIRHKGFNTVRIVASAVDNNYWWNASGADNGLKQYVLKAKANSLSVILAYYNKPFMDSYNSQNMINVGNWWTKDVRGGNGTSRWKIFGNSTDFDINLVNEPHAAGNAVQWRNEQNVAINKLRASGYTGRIIVDVPGYAHELNFVRQEGKNVAKKVGNTPTKVAFAIHIYPDSFYGGALPVQPSNVSNAAMKTADKNFMNQLLSDAGHTIIIGEFGDTYKGSNGKAVIERGRVERFIKAAQESNAHCGTIGWSWNGNGSPLQSMDAKNSTGYFDWVKNTAWHQ